MIHEPPSQALGDHAPSAQEFLDEELDALSVTHTAHCGRRSRFAPNTALHAPPPARVLALAAAALLALGALGALGVGAYVLLGGSDTETLEAPEFSYRGLPD